MSLDKAIESGKEHRRDSRRFDGSCRNHVGCPWCERGRQYQKLKLEIAAQYERAATDLDTRYLENHYQLFRDDAGVEDLDTATAGPKRIFERSEEK